MVPSYTKPVVLSAVSISCNASGSVPTLRASAACPADLRTVARVLLAACVRIAPAPTRKTTALPCTMLYLDSAFYRPTASVFALCCRVVFVLLACFAVAAGLVIKQRQAAAGGGAPVPPAPKQVVAQPIWQTRIVTCRANIHDPKGYTCSTQLQNIRP